MKVHKILRFDACLITCFFIGQIWSNARAEPFRKECARKGIFKKKQKDSSLQSHVIKTIEVNHLAMCTIACLDHAQCKSYNFQETENPLKLCELSSSTKDSSSSDVISRPGYSYYDAQDEPPCYSSCPGEKCVYTCSGPPTCKCPENIYYPVFQGRHCEYPYPASCKMVKDIGFNQGDGEYQLYLLHPTCSKPARVYCADMDTENPLEYVTLPAGRTTNYGFNNRRPPGSAHTWQHGKTGYNKIRLNVTSLNVMIQDSRFSTQMEGTEVVAYGRADDCLYQRSCTGFATVKVGITEANLDGTDFQFPSSIPYRIHAWPACAKVLINPTMSGDRKKWSVRCGGRCGSCQPDPLVLHVDGC
ncbi:A disintegrin and metalloproteinase with thrombospondin motifs 9-like [Dendronephthya gigantea]|uniref:A disintegrin and metalloproteinase with thrombospondin motifs 9-like n=1 Tax=Dendronephthya gigantea TaxID=151771 RepID=UPI00106AB0FA|nr:A disintegrin and metalloproteinase with thrombospondin motifs 9-like [Dendronephthya gigantea]